MMRWRVLQPCRQATAALTRVTTRVGAGTERFMAPELYAAGARATAASDVYAFGVTVVQVAGGRGEGGVSFCLIGVAGD